MVTNIHEKYIKRCLELAHLGMGSVSPNPMVGSVIVLHETIIGEGYHMQFGGPHAEVNAIHSVQDKSLLKQATIYVSLEPCSHFGKTPPCADLIIASKIPKVVIATLDSNAVVCGNGVQKLKDAGIEVDIGVLEKEANQLNVAFNTFHQKKRPLVILKWAETADSFLDKKRDSRKEKAVAISDKTTSIWVHQLRSRVDAILVGRKTVDLDNPSLTTRKWNGKNPIRVIIDPHLKIIKDSHIFNSLVKTYIFNTIRTHQELNLEWIQIKPNKPFLPTLLSELYQRKIQSILIEGGTTTIQQFIDEQLFDQCFVIKSSLKIKNGVLAPQMNMDGFATQKIEKDLIYYND